MKATVTQLISGEGYTDKQLRVQLRFADATCGFNEVRVPVVSLGVDGVALDDVLEIRISRHGEETLPSTIEQSLQGEMSKRVAEGK
jgi:hypothetical protein